MTIAIPESEVISEYNRIEEACRVAGFCAHFISYNYRIRANIGHRLILLLHPNSNSFEEKERLEQFCNTLYPIFSISYKVYLCSHIFLKEK